MSTFEIIFASLIALAVVEIGWFLFDLSRTTRELRALHDSIDSANEAPLRQWVSFPAEWCVSEKAGQLTLCHAHLEQHDQERGVSFTPLEPARAGSQCAACLRDEAILKAARTA